MAAMKPRKSVSFSLADTHVRYDPHDAPSDRTNTQIGKVTTAPVHRFGPLPDPISKPARAGKDFTVDIPNRQVTSTHQHGASLTVDPAASPLTGKYRTLPQGSPIPMDMELRDDNPFGKPDSHHAPGHVSLFNTTPMSFETYQQRMATVTASFDGGGTKAK
ncbi:hypothetical protein IGB42_01310 [Andreprevotia sp. IGB-42]|uniref:hypothetical protein n=1 Tax=Andreprevotia sp. IGB-42 TaxID=2497473 RepID=UPI001356D8E0|nr:hypothetical protein [Andreprevotia sp. IGB-42]KAF0814409.1 hypothetical protein IGB42_01310 [Andreprevotia sp. IGB-42]